MLIWVFDDDTDHCRLRIGTWESVRLYNYWLGLPVPPRAWKLKAPQPRPHTQPQQNPHRNEL
jgi:ERO1-like protein beta